MALVLADVGADMALEALLNNAWPVGGKNLTLKLFVNDYTPLDTSVAGDFTVAAGGGYGNITLTNGSWTVADAAGIMTGSYAQQTFTFTGPLNGTATIYGYYVIDADGVLGWGERLTAAFTPANNGDLLKITAKFSMSKGTPT